MTRRYTGAEARELAAKATSEALEVGHGFEGAYVLNKNREHPFYAHCVGARAVERAALLAAAPDLAESLAAVEAERDALSRALFLSDAARDNEESAYLALLAERDALRAAARELLGAYGDFSVEYPPTIDEAARFHAALAALRETAK